MKTVDFYHVNKKKSNAHTHGRRKPRHDISSSGLRPVELKIKINKCRVALRCIVATRKVNTCMMQMLIIQYWKKTQMYLPHIRINTRTTKSNNNTGFCIYPFKNKEINTGHLKCAKWNINNWLASVLLQTNSSIPNKHIGSLQNVQIQIIFHKTNSTFSAPNSQT